MNSILQLESFIFLLTIVLFDVYHSCFCVAFHFHTRSALAVAGRMHRCTLYLMQLNAAARCHGNSI